MFAQFQHKILSLTAENILRLKLVHIEFKDDVVILGGGNEQGKSSALDALEMALSGTKNMPKKPIHEGCEKARVVVEFEDMIVTRTFTAKKTELVITNREGHPFNSPQTILDNLISRVSFDPMRFMNMKPADQANTLRKLAGIDTSNMDAKREALYAERTNVNRDLKKLENQLSTTPQHSDAPEEIISVKALMLELNEAQEVNKAKDDATKNANKAVDQSNVQKLKHSNQKTRFEALVLELEAARNDLEKAKQNEITAIEFSEELFKKSQNMPWIDTNPIQSQISNAETINEKVRDNQKRADLDVNIKATADKSKSLTADMQQIDTDKAKLLAEAKYPLPGLTVTESSEVLLDGIPLAQASSAQKIKLTTKISFALNPGLPLALIRDGSLLDEKSLQVIAETAAECDGQVLMERVGTGDEITVIIEDGEVASK